MRDSNIYSLQELKRRKYAIRKATREFEEEFADDFYNLTHLFSNAGNCGTLSEDSDSSSCSNGLTKLIVNGRRLVEIFKLGVNIVKDFKR